ncbi:UNVERIFIED_CONTAM: Glutaredoxin-C4 [Trichonephila clavipes]
MAAAQIDAKLLEDIENYVKTNKVMIFSKSRCPYCHKVKELFKELGVEYFALELDTLEGGAQLQQAMAKKVGRSSVPQVFINEEHVGGCDETVDAHENGILKPSLLGCLSNVKNSSPLLHWFKRFLGTKSLLCSVLPNFFIATNRLTLALIIISAS